MAMRSIGILTFCAAISGALLNSSVYAQTAPGIHRQDAVASGQVYVCVDGQACPSEFQGILNRGTLAGEWWVVDSRNDLVWHYNVTRNGSGGAVMQDLGVDSGTRLQRVADYLAAHLDEPLSLDRLAAVAAMSPFHFHRLWTAVVGETVAASVRRLRLQRAAHQLLSSPLPITTIALSAGFSTAQAFARSFRAVAGSTPSQYRATPSEWPAWEMPAPAIGPPGIEVRLVRMEPISIVAMRRSGTFTDSDLAEDFQIPWQWALDTGRLEQLRGIYGVPWNEPEVAELPLFFAGLDLGTCPVPPAPMEAMVLRGGIYAVARRVGSYEGIAWVSTALYRSWLPASGWEPADAPLFHHYLDDPEATPEAQCRTDVYLPLSPPSEAAADQ